MASNRDIRKFRVATARTLRANATPAENILWRVMKRIPVLETHFRRQVAIGPYVADFGCLSGRLLIEVDGPSHTEPGAPAHDAARTLWLETEGYRVIRFWNQEIYDNIDGVLDTIHAALYGSLDAGPR